MKEFKNRREAYEFIAGSSIYGNLGLFIGAGFPMAVLNEDRDIALSWPILLAKCAKEFEIEYHDILSEGLSYPQIASHIAKQVSAILNLPTEKATSILKEKIADLTCWYPEKDKKVEFRNLLLDLFPKWIITTNYDLVIESILTDRAYSLQPNDPIVSHNELIAIYHLHGIRTNPESLVITQEDYIALFRPNEYRLQRIPILLKESVTLMIGYNLGDINVLTAVDWVKNVFPKDHGNYPHHIIQLLYKPKKPKVKPYFDQGICILEFGNLEQVLKEINAVIVEQREKHRSDKNNRDEIINLLQTADEDFIHLFNDDEGIRTNIFEMYEEYSVHLTSSLLDFLSRCMDELWKKSSKPRAFSAYDNMLNILIDLLRRVNPKDIQPALMESIAYNLNRVAYYIGNKLGQSFEAKKTWERRQSEIKLDVLRELMHISKVNKFYRLNSLITDGHY